MKTNPRVTEETAAVRDAQAAGSSKRRENNFDFLRLFLAILVIFSHSYPLGLGTETNEPFVRLTRGQTTGGGIAVDLFFVMSGYLITASFLRSDGVPDYLGKRVRRIYPGFIVVMLIGALAIIPLSGGSIRAFDPNGQIGRVLGRFVPLSNEGLAAEAGRLVNFAGNLLFLREPLYAGTFPHNPTPNMVNGSVWTIPIEFWCYIGVMILGVAGLLRRRMLIACVFFGTVLFGLSVNLLHLHIQAVWLGFIIGDVPSWTRLLPMYLAGVVAYLFRDMIRYNLETSLICLLALLAACFIPFALSGVLPLAAAYLLFWVAFNPSIRLHRAAKFGDFSYGTYLYAFPVQQMIVKAWGKPMNPFVLFSLAAPVTLVFAIASWHFIERPFLNMRRRPDVIQPVDAA